MQNDNAKFKIIRYLGIDWGGARIGLALGDSEVKLATPFKVVSSIDEIEQAIKEESVDVIVVGKPLKMKNAKLKMQNEFLNFLNLLTEKIDIPVKTVDERLSSKHADALFGDRKVKAPQDAVAAMLILQSYLDKHEVNE